MLKYYGRTFLPWIALAVVSGFDARTGAITGLAAALVLLALDRLRSGIAWNALILETSTTVYMALLTALSFAAPGSPVLGYGASLAIAWLAVTAWGTLAAGRPFTEGIARRQVEAHIAATERFRQINVVITRAWAVGFTLTAIALACVQHWAPQAVAVLVACKVAGFTLPAVFTARYTARARERAAAAAATRPTL
ncbi:hypothetical protein [Nonomuraea rhodomycinica]|uniref:Intracellular septation protein A n=1 Tax=Nonomuraea rhodomycinica TaxID=1712872 RepID=A0A7Y6IPB0_9ACTN|nr:hypothetical protein [Nonomuraea rhodomycinica]NUW41932.1 hypothetical protein [Nonomuraea rhodomycinica]